MYRSIVLALWIGAAQAPVVEAQVPSSLGVDQAKAMAEMQQQFMRQFDANKNGKLDGPEQMMAQEAMRQQGFALGIPPGGFPGAEQFGKAFDRNEDGKLNQMEAMMAQKAWQRMRGGARGGSGGASGGSYGAGAPQPVVPVAPASDKKNGKVPPLIKRFDKDGDGKLNAEEKATAQAELKKGKSKEKDAKPKEKAAKKDGK